MVRCRKLSILLAEALLTGVARAWGIKVAVIDMPDVAPIAADSLIAASGDELVGGGVSLQELRDGLEYNHAETYIRSEYEKEAEVTEWFITARGIQQENIK